MSTPPATTAVAEAVALYEDDRYAQAVLRLREARDEGDPSAVDDAANVVAKIRATEAELVDMLEAMFDDDDDVSSTGKGGRWRPAYVARGVTVAVDRRRQWGDRLLRVRCQGQRSDVDVFGVCAALFEIACFPEWMPGVDEAIVERTYSKFRKIVRVSGPKPWPFRRDECIVEAYGDVVKCGALLRGAKKKTSAAAAAASHSAASSSSSRKGVFICLKPSYEVARTKGRHYAEITGGWFVERSAEATPSNTTNGKGVALTLVARIDPKLRFVPSWVVNFIIRQIAFLFIPMVASFATQFLPGGPKQHLIEEKPEIYAEIRRRLDSLEDDDDGARCRRRSFSDDDDVDVGSECGGSAEAPKISPPPPPPREGARRGGDDEEVGTRGQQQQREAAPHRTSPGIAARSPSPRQREDRSAAATVSSAPHRSPHTSPRALPVLVALLAVAFVLIV